MSNHKRLKHAVNMRQALTGNSVRDGASPVTERKNMLTFMPNCVIRKNSLQEVIICGWVLETLNTVKPSCDTGCANNIHVVTYMPVIVDLMSWPLALSMGEILPAGLIKTTWLLYFFIITDTQRSSVQVHNANRNTMLYSVCEKLTKGLQKTLELISLPADVWS